MSAYYNEHDKYAAEWLRELIKEGHIAPGIVDERSIEDILPDELVGYTQVHFFAGIGIWSAALRGAGWPDDRPVWTGSCPCQPFSQAGKGKGTSDERHLWPAFFHLIQNGKQPEVPVFGEQVASKDGLAWLDTVQADMEAEGYSFGAVDICAAGFGAPHIRQRLFFHAERLDNTTGSRCIREVGDAEINSWDEARMRVLGLGCEDDGLAHPGHGEHIGRNPVREADGEHGGSEGAGEGTGAERVGEVDDASVRSTGDGVADAEYDGHGEQGGLTTEQDINGKEVGVSHGRYSTYQEQPTSGPTNGFWGDPDWLYGKDDKWRPVRSGSFPLAHESPARVVLLRGYGNAIVKEVAQEFIKAVMAE